MPKDECNELKTIQYKTMLLNHKEIKEDIKCDSSTNIEDFLNKESKMHKVEPWNKLDKTIHLLCSELVTSPGLHGVHVGLVPPLLYVLIGHFVHTFGLHIHFFI